MDDLLRALERAGDGPIEKMALWLARRRLGLRVIHPRIDDYDWSHVFAYAENACLAAVGPISPFTREDVVDVLAAVDGENDGPDWIIVGQLEDGRWFALRAGCDYTGWD